MVGRPDDVTGEAIVAFVVLKRARPTGDEALTIAKELRDWVAKEIGPIAKPKDIRFGDTLTLIQHPGHSQMYMIGRSPVEHNKNRLLRCRDSGRSSVKELLAPLPVTLRRYHRNFCQFRQSTPQALDSGEK